MVGDIIRVFVLANLAVCLLSAAYALLHTVMQGLQISLFWPLVLKTAVYPLHYSVPVSFLLAATLVIGRMASDLEVSALATHGVPQRQIYAPVMLLAAVLCGLSWYLNGWVVPEIHFEKRNPHRYVLKQLQSLGSGRERTLRLPSNKGDLWVAAYDGPHLRGVKITLKTPKRESIVPALREYLPTGLPDSIVVNARSGRLDIHPDENTVNLHLKRVQLEIPEPVGADVFVQRIGISDTIVVPLRFDRKSPGLKDRVTPDLENYIAAMEEVQRLDELKRARRAARRDGSAIVPATYREEPGAARGGEVRPATSRVDATLLTPDDGRALDGRAVGQERELNPRKLPSARTEWHRRLALTLACLTFPLIAVSLGLLFHGRSRMLPFLLANVVALGVFYPLLAFGVYLGNSGWYPPLTVALPNLALLAIGVTLTRRALRE